MIRNPSKPIIISGRHFTGKDFRLISDIVSLYPNLSRSELAQTIAENLKWYQSNGEPKHEASQIVLAKMEKWGQIKLSPLKSATNKGRRHEIAITERTAHGEMLAGEIGQFGRIIIEPIMGNGSGRLWNEYMARYHYLGYKGVFGSQQRYFVKLGDDRLLGCLSYSASAWSVSCRDEWIGWNRAEKAKRLHLIIANSRFLIFPWIKITNLASKSLSLAAKRIPFDWEARYNYRPVLIETFVDRERFKGTCYRAANYIRLGVTKGRGRMDYYHQKKSTSKDLFVYPLVSSFRDALKGGNQ
jgi:hypothetical protein